MTLAQQSLQEAGEDFVRAFVCLCALRPFLAARFAAAGGLTTIAAGLRWLDGA